MRINIPQTVHMTIAPKITVTKTTETDIIADQATFMYECNYCKRRFPSQISLSCHYPRWCYAIVQVDNVIYKLTTILFTVLQNTRSLGIAPESNNTLALTCCDSCPELICNVYIVAGIVYIVRSGVDKEALAHTTCVCLPSLPP